MKRDLRGGADSSLRAAFDPEAASHTPPGGKRQGLSLVAAVLGWGLGKPARKVSWGVGATLDGLRLGWGVGFRKC